VGFSGLFLKLPTGILATGLLATVFLMAPANIQGVKAQSTSVGKTGLPIPRFVSLKSGKANMRVGPGAKFAVDWQYVKKGLPMEIIQEFDNWRKVRDSQGNEGWMLHSLLSGKRTAIINPWESDKSKGMANLKSEAEVGSNTIARIEPGVIAEVDYCDEDWCHVTFETRDGYVNKANVWGVYPDELIEE